MTSICNHMQSTEYDHDLFGMFRYNPFANVELAAYTDGYRNAQVGASNLREICFIPTKQYKHYKENLPIVMPAP